MTDGASPGPSPRNPGGRIPFQKLGLYFLLAGEVMFFGGLISAFLMFRLSMDGWPPPGQPRFPVGLTALNTLALLASGVTIHLSSTALRAGKAYRGLLTATLVLGATFLFVQGTEWARLIAFGLTASSGIYAGLFYVLIGVHAFHVLVGLLALLWAWRQASLGRFTPDSTMGLDLCGIYWFFVVGIWPILYYLVYLS